VRNPSIYRAGCRRRLRALVKYVKKNVTVVARRRHGVDTAAWTMFIPLLSDGVPFIDAFFTHKIMAAMHSMHQINKQN